MLKNELNNVSEILKTLTAPASTDKRADEWRKEDAPHPAILAAPPQWTRYIDSRLKQFCTR